MLAVQQKAKLIYTLGLSIGFCGGAAKRRRTEERRSRMDLPELGESFGELLEHSTTAATGKKQVDLREKHVVELNGSAPRDSAMFSTDTRRIRESARRST